MKLVLITAMFAVMNLGAFAQQAPGLAAHWEGGIQLPDHEMRITLDLAKNSKGDWIGSVSIPDGRIVDTPLLEISVKDTAMRFSIGFAHDSFDAKLSEDGNGLTGTATSDHGPAPFQLKRSGEANVKLPPPSTPLSKDFEGPWEGTLDVSGKQLRAVLKLTSASSGVATGTLISLDEGGQEFPITTITQKDQQLQFEIRLIRGKYTGILSGAEIAGEYTIDGLTLPLVFRRPADGR
jgi:hypothetical protein